MVIDIGGGSTEFVVGAGGRDDFHVSTQAGVVRQTERHLHADPPRREELEALADDVRAIIDGGGAAEVRRASPAAAIAVAGTATSSPRSTRSSTPTTPTRVHGYR